MKNDKESSGTPVCIISILEALGNLHSSPLLVCPLWFLSPFYEQERSILPNKAELQHKDMLWGDTCWEKALFGSLGRNRFLASEPGLEHLPPELTHTGSQEQLAHVSARARAQWAHNGSLQNWTQWKYLYCGNWQLLQIRVWFLFWGVFLLWFLIASQCTSGNRDNVMIFRTRLSWVHSGYATASRCH